MVAQAAQAVVVLLRLQISRSLVEQVALEIPTSQVVAEQLEP